MITEGGEGSWHWHCLPRVLIWEHLNIYSNKLIKFQDMGKVSLIRWWCVNVISDDIMIMTLRYCLQLWLYDVVMSTHGFPCVTSLVVWPSPMASLQRYDVQQMPMSEFPRARAIISPNVEIHFNHLLEGHTMTFRIFSVRWLIIFGSDRSSRSANLCPISPPS